MKIRIPEWMTRTGVEKTRDGVMVTYTAPIEEAESWFRKMAQRIRKIISRSK